MPTSRMPFRIGSNRIGRLAVGEIYDTDARAYFQEVVTQGGTLSTFQKQAISDFYVTLKGDAVYDKLHAMYLFLGGTENSNAVDAITPGGTYDAAFNGTWSHSISGSSTTDNNANYIETSLDPSAFDSTTNFSFGQMIVDAGVGNGYSGIGDAAAKYLLLGQANTDLDTWNGSSPALVADGAYQSGVLHINSRTGSNAWSRNYILANSNGTNNATALTGTLTEYSATLWFNNVNGAATNAFSGRYLFAYMGEGLDGTEIQNLADAVNTLQKAFNRNLWV